MKKHLYAIFFLFVLFSSHSINAQIITTIAGNGFFCYSGDGRMATAAQLHSPYGIVSDGAGNFYIADTYNQCIRKVSSSGIISTVAGTGTMGYGGDGGAATAAKLNYPTSVAIDLTGNIYIADQKNNRIRKVDAAGIITTIVGGASPGSFGDGTIATGALLNSPTAVTIDGSGNIYIADCYNNVIRKISGGIIRRVAGNYVNGYSGDGVAATTTKLNYPTDVAVDAAGNIYIADQQNNRIRKVDLSGIIKTIGGNGTDGYSGDGGAATSAELALPQNVTVDPTGNVYIADNENHSIRKISTSGIITTVTGTGVEGFNGDGAAATAAELNFPGGIAVYSGNIHFADAFNNRVRMINTSGIINTFAGGMANGTPATAHSINPYGIIIDAVGNIYLSDADNNRVCRIDVAGNITTIAGNGTISPGTHTHAHSHTLVYNGDGGPATAGRLDYPAGITMDGGGNIYVIERDNNCVRKISSSGIITTFAGNGNVGFNGDGGPATNAEFHDPTGIAVDLSGNIYIADYGNHRIRIVNTAGVITTFAGGGLPGYLGDGGPATDAELQKPHGVHVDVNGNIFIADRYDHRIRKISKSGTINTIAGDGTSGSGGDGSAATSAQLRFPTGVTTDSSGNIYITDGSNRYRKINALGVINTVAGKGPPAFSGDGGAATAAELNFPTAIVVDDSGTVYIADYDNYRIRKVQRASLAPITGITSMCVTATTTLSDATPGGTWSSADTAIATVGLTTGVVTGVSGGTATIIYAVGINTVTKTVTVVPVPSAGVITGPAMVCVGASITLTDTVSGGIWTRSNLKATVTGGLVTGISAGTIVIGYLVTKTCGSASTTVTITINPLPVAGVITGASTVCAGSSITLTDASPGGIWSSSNTTATVSGGLVTGAFAGRDTITYAVTNTCGTATATKAITVNPLPAAGSITGTSSVCTGSTISLTSGVSGGVWSSSNTTATVSLGLVTGSFAGTDTIRCTVTNSCGTAVATKTITVIAFPTAGTITGPSSVCTGASILLTDAIVGGVWSATNTNASVSGGMVTGATTGKDTIRYTVTNTCGTATAAKTITITTLASAGSITGPSAVCAGSAIVLTNATIGGYWTSANTTLATVGTGSGIVTGIAAGVNTISYNVTNSCGTATATYTITVNPLPVAITGTMSFCEGTTTTLSDADPGGAWSSSSTAVAMVGSGSGIVSGVAAGTSRITYTLSTGCLTTSIVTVNPMPFAYTITGGGPYCIGDTGVHIGLSGSAYGKKYQLYNGSIATGTPVAGTGSAIDFGLQTTAGIYTVDATDTITTCTNNMTSSVTVTINPLPVTITGPADVCVGSLIALSDGTPGGSWTSSNTSLATVGSATGIAGGVSAGSPSIIYTLPTGCKTSISVTVNPLPSSIKGVAAVCAGLSATLSNTGGGTWTSSSTIIATIGTTSGLLSGTAAGTATISYTLATGCFTTRIATVNPLPAAISGANQVCVSATTGLSNTSAGGAWTSGNNGIATIDIGTGVLSGVSVGTTTITYTLPTTCTITTSVTVNPLPFAGLITGVPAVCLDSVIALSDMIAGGTWTSTTSAATVTSTGLVTGITIGVDTIIYSVTNVCGTDKASWPLTIVQCDFTTVQGVHTPASELKIYPNPNDGDFVIALLSSFDETAVVTITNVLGQQVITLPLVTNKETPVTIQNVHAAGIYMVTVVTANGSSYTGRIVVNR